MRLKNWIRHSNQFQLGETNCSNFHSLSLFTFKNKKYPSNWFIDKCFSEWKGISFIPSTNKIINLNISKNKLQNLPESFA